jgi:hypothetical protein
MAELIVPISASDQDGFTSRDGTSSEWPPTGTITPTTNTSSDFGLQARRVLNDSINFTNICTGHLRFDTSALPDDATVTAAVLRISPTSILAAEVRALNFEWHDFGAALGTEDYVADVGTTAAQVAGATWQAWATGSGTVDVTLGSLSNISLTGATGIRIGVDGATDPPGPPDETQIRLNIAEWDHATRDEPKLVITYTADAGSSVLVVPPVRRVF